MDTKSMKELTGIIESVDVSELPTTKAIMFIRDHLVSTYGVNAKTAAQAAVAAQLKLGFASENESDMNTAYDMLESLIEIVLSVVLALVGTVHDEAFHDVFIEYMRQVKIDFQ